MVIEKSVQRREIARAESGTMLDVDGHEARPDGKDQIALKALRCSPEVGIPQYTEMPEQLPNFHDNEKFEKSAEIGRAQEPTAIPNSLQMKGKSCVGQYPLGLAYEALCSCDVSLANWYRDRFYR